MATPTQSLKARLLAASTTEHTAMLDESVIFNEKDVISTPIPMLNVAYSGSIGGGISPGIITWAGPSKHFKSIFALIGAASYLSKYPDAILIFYDSEFGTPKSYFDSLNIDKSRVIHIPVTTVEGLREDITNQLDVINRGDRVIFIVDSLGNLASRKETQDALDGSEKADMTRARVIKSLFRLITPHLRIKNIPFINISHTYKTLEMFSKDVVGGGTGVYYASDCIFIVGRQQDKDGKEIAGFNYTINVEKSRYVKEKSKINVAVRFESGIDKWSGLFDESLEANIIEKVTAQSYRVVGAEKTFKRATVESDGEFWKEMLVSTNLADVIQEKYTLAHGQLISDSALTNDIIDDDIDEDIVA